MNIARLQRLIYVLENVATPETFDMSKWVGHKRSQIGEFCGTTCCAAGWAALDPVLRGGGLLLTGISEREVFRDIHELNEYAEIHAVAHIRPYYYSRGRDFHGVLALAEFFDISYERTLYIFVNRGATIADVVLRIRHILLQANEVVA